MIDAELVNIASLMTTYNFEIEQLPDNLKCTQCKLVLKNACQVPCGCTYCRACIDIMISRGLEFCPGGSDDCRKSPLSRFQSHYGANKNIIKLAVKCPNDWCVHECRLANIEEHLRECSRKTEECLFRELGCTQDKLAAKEMGGHLLHENRRHSEILIRMIANINREIETLKQRDEASSREIETLKHELLMKDDQIKSIMDQMIHVQNENKSIKNDIKLIKEEKEDLAGRVRILTEKIERETAERHENGELDSARVIEHVDREIATVTRLIGSNKTESATEIKLIKKVIFPVQSLLAPFGMGQVDASCMWLIDDDIENTFWNWRDKRSEHFSGVAHPYKFALGSGNYRGNAELCFQLRSFHGPNDEELPFPFHGILVVTVRDNDEYMVCRSYINESFTKRPSDNCYTWSETIHCPHSELRDAGLKLTNGVLVSCMVIPDVGKYRHNYVDMSRL